jgi:hypothetical protein
MRRLACIAALITAPVYAAEYPSRVDVIGKGRDSVEIVAEGPYRATVRYTNSADQSSAPGVVTVQIGNIIADVTISIGGSSDGNKERAVVEPRGDYIAIPPDGWAEDGETISFVVTLPMF